MPMFTRKSLSRLVLVLLLLMLISLPHFAECANDFGIRGLKSKGAKLKSACQMVNDADIGWYRGAIFWKSIVDDEGNFNWENLDKQINKILRHKTKIIFTLRCVHELFAPGSGKVDLDYKTVWQSAPPAPEYLEHYKDFVRSVIERYDGDGFSDAIFIKERKNIKHWQIENEPGKTPDKGSNFWKGTASDYADLYLVAYDIIKEADAEAKVALSGFTYAAIKYSMKHGNSFPLEVLRILNERGGDFDIFDFHFYKDYTRFSADKALHPLLHTYPQFRDKPIWVTETNVNRKKLDPYYSSENYDRFVAKDIVRRYSVLLEGKAKKVFWVKFSDQKDATWNVPMEPEDYWHFRGLTEYDLTAKPVYYTYALLIEKIKGKDRVRRKSKLESESDVWIYKFGKNDNAVYAMWYDDGLGRSTEAEIPLPWDQVLITRIITEPGATEPETEIRTLNENGKLEITLDDSPIFVEKY